MKTKILFALFFIYSSLNFAQAKVELQKENQKFYFPASSFKNTKDFQNNLNNLVLKIAPMEIDEKTQKFSKDAGSIYLIQKNFKGLVNYSKNETFPKASLPLKDYAEAIITDPTQGNQFKKIFTDNFSKEFNKLNGPTKTSIANGFFNEQILAESYKSAADFKDQLSKNKSDSISYKDALKLIDFESFSQVSNVILPLGRNVAKDYVHELFQPYIIGNLGMSVFKPLEVNDLPDISKDCKLLFELTNFSGKSDKETAFKSENTALIEAGRIINLHIASGIPAEKLKVVFVLHGGAINILMNDITYKENYKVENPNLSLIKQMQSKGATFVVCGQLMTWMGLKLGDLTENIKEAYSAKTALTNYQSQGYILNTIKEE